MNAKFWEFTLAGGLVKLKMKPGGSLCHRTFCWTDEGWNRTETTWYYDGKYVIRDTCFSGLDCDGRLDRYTMTRCEARDLHAGDELEEGICLPHWEKIESSQRDYSAEAMGY